MKIYKTLFLGLGLIALSSCSDFLNQTSPSELDNESTFNNAYYTELALNKVYGSLTQDQTYSNFLPIIAGTNTDCELIDGLGTDASNTSSERGNMNYNANPGWSQLSKVWDAMNGVIENANLVVDGINNSQLIQQAGATRTSMMKFRAEFLLQIILKRADLKVREVHGQYSIKNLQGRSVRLDILAVDEQNRAYNIEVQRSDRGASEKRARYNSSLLDANLTHSGSNYDALNETYIIFITENDVLKAGLPIYHIHRMVEETGTVFNDQSHIIYVNSQIKDETALGKLMHDFFCTDAKDMFYPVLANRVQYFKHDAKGVATMCRAMEEMRKDERIECALEMLADGMPYEKVAKYSKLSIEEVKELASKKSA